MTSLERRAETSLWPLVDHVVRTHGLAGLAVAVVQDGEVALARGFGTRDVRTGAPVTPETLFHLASVSKTFVAAAVVGLTPPLDLDAPVVRWLPDLTLADGRQAEVTLRHLLTHTSGIPDVTDYGWHDPQLGDDALAELVRGLSSARLSTTPGTRFAYCNLGYEVLGHVLATVRGTTFEEAMTTLVLDPAGMHRSTFLRADVAPDLAAAPHVGMPLTVPGDSYPYTRRHAPSSTLHSSVAELSRWMIATLDDAGTAARRWQPEADVGDPPWDEAVGLGWFLGSHRGERTVGHAGADPGFTSRLVLVPERRTGVVALANSNTAPTGAVVRAALDLALDLPQHARRRPSPRRAPAPDHRPAGAGARRVRGRRCRRRVPPADVRRTGAGRRRRRPLRRQRLGRHRAAPPRPGPTAPGRVDDGPSGLVAGVGDDRVGAPGGR